MREQDWLVARINDIMNHKEITLDKLAKMVGMKYPMELQRHFYGPNHITPSLFSKIAKAFDITEERLENTDHIAEKEYLQKTLKTGKCPREIRRISFDLVRKSVGAKERIEALRDLGWCFYHMGRSELAKKVWEQGYKLAEKKDKRVKGQIIDSAMRFRLLMDLTVYHTDKCEYSHALKLLEAAEALITTTNDPGEAGLVHQQKGLCLSKLGKKEIAKKQYLLARECFKKAEDQIRLGRIMMNLASLEYHFGNKDLSLEYLQEAVPLLKNDTPYIQANVDKDYAKSLIASGRRIEALGIVERRLALSEDEKVPDAVLAQLLLIKCDLAQDISSGERIFTLKNIARELLCKTADILTILHARNGDISSTIKYHELMKNTLPQGVEDYMKGEWFG